MTKTQPLTRRAMMVSGAALASVTAAYAQPVWPSGRTLVFDIWRKQRDIGRHTVTFRGDARNFVVAIETAVKIGFGPMTVFQYHFQAAETWAGGQFSSFQSRALTNGKPEWVQAMREADGVLIKTAAGSHLAPPATLPLAHWNPQALKGPIFDFETGKMLREIIATQTGQTVSLANGQSVAATRYSLSGDLDIIEWYDAQGALAAMKVKAMDGSWLDYRRMA